MSRNEHRVGKRMSATVRRCKDGCGTIHAQTRPQETAPAKTDCKDMSWKWVHMIQRTGDTLAGRLDGRTTVVQGAP